MASRQKLLETFCAETMDTPYETGIIVGGTRQRFDFSGTTTRRLPDSFYPLTRKTSASSLFRPRRNILAVFDGVFYLVKLGAKLTGH
jgi:hypothetical protein